MKKNMTFLVIVVLSICLVGLAAERIAPVHTVHAASENHLVMNSASQSINGTAPRPHAIPPIVFIAAGLVCALFGIVAVSPLLIDDPDKLLHEAGCDTK